MHKCNIHSPCGLLIKAEGTVEEGEVCKNAMHLLANLASGCMQMGRSRSTARKLGDKDTTCAFCLHVTLRRDAQPKEAWTEYWFSCWWLEIAHKQSFDSNAAKTFNIILKATQISEIRRLAAYSHWHHWCDVLQQLWYYKQPHEAVGEKTNSGWEGPLLFWWSSSLLILPLPRQETTTWCNPSIEALLLKCFVVMNTPS